MALDQEGFAILPGVFSREFLDCLLQEIHDLAPRRSRAGVRHAMRLAPVADLAQGSEMIEIAREVLGPHAFPFRATLFDKSPAANWLVVWHSGYGLAIAIANRGKWLGSLVGERRDSLRARADKCFEPGCRAALEH
jgi:hypothetical protein